MGKNLSSKYGQKLLDRTKKSVTDAFKTASKRAIQKMAEVTGDLAGNKIAGKITKAAFKSSFEDSRKSVQSTEMPKEIYILPEK